ncbi:hypothetical protein WCP94_002625 [Bilophila wadsworthia]
MPGRRNLSEKGSFSLSPSFSACLADGEAGIPFKKNSVAAP